MLSELTRAIYDNAALDWATSEKVVYAMLVYMEQKLPRDEYTKFKRYMLGDVEYQLCQSMDEGGRFDSWIKARGYEGLHHICYAVDDIDAALAEALAKGATLKECSACKVKGSHVHPEGWVAFLDQEAGGIELEMMQVYTPQQLEEYNDVKGI